MSSELTYTLHVSGYSGTAGDSLNLMKSTTKNNDNDPGNCMG